MSIVSKEAIEVIAQSIGINNLSSDVASALASDVEYRLREIMQEAIKCMRHSRRNVMTSDDVDCAFKLRNVEPIFGFTSGDPLRFKRAVAHKDLFYIDEKDVEFKDIVDAPLPKAPLDTTVTAHWLAVEGVQPAIPENPPPEAVVAISDGKKYELKEDGISVDVKLPVKHVLSKELQLYFDKIKDLALDKSDSNLFKQALLSLATDSGLHPLVPYFTRFIVDEVSRSLNKIPVLFALVRMVQSIIENPHIHIEPYLHQLMPPVITCVVTKRLGIKVTDNHWEIRDFSARLAASICKRFGHVYHNLQPRVTRTLLHTFMDPKKTLPQHYGAIQGLAALGSSVVRLLILPNLEPYLQLLKPDMMLETQKNEVKRNEAWCVYGALQVISSFGVYVQLINFPQLSSARISEIQIISYLLPLQCASGLCMYEQLKRSRIVLSPPSRSVWKISQKVVTTMSNKRKASSDNLVQQPPQTKLATESTTGSMQIDRAGMVSGFSTAAGSSSLGTIPAAAMSRHLSNENMAGRGDGGGWAVAARASSVLSQAWKEDLNAGHLLASLTEFFGEGMFAFTPKPELSMFL